MTIQPLLDALRALYPTWKKWSHRVSKPRAIRVNCPCVVVLDGSKRVTILIPDGQGEAIEDVPLSSVESARNT